jgi:hypothetical protein
MGQTLTNILPEVYKDNSIITNNINNINNTQLIQKKYISKIKWRYNFIGQGPYYNRYICRLVVNANKYIKWFEYAKLNNNLEDIRKKYQDELYNLLELEKTPEVLIHNKKMAIYYNEINYKKYINYIQEINKLKKVSEHINYNNLNEVEYKKIIDRIKYLMANYSISNKFLQTLEQYYENYSYRRVRQRIIKLEYLLSLIDKVSNNM